MIIISVSGNGASRIGFARILLSVILSPILAGAGDVYADDLAVREVSPSNNIDQSTSTTDRKRLEEVLVTAERRSADLQDVPVAVSVFTSETREIVGIDSITDFAKFTPGLSYSSDDDRVFVRGIGKQTNTAGSEPGLSLIHI